MEIFIEEKSTIAASKPPQLHQELRVTTRRCVVKLTDLELVARSSLYDGEQRTPQSLILNVEAEVFPLVDDNLENTLDYNVILQIARRGTRQCIKLIEALAYRIATECTRYS